MGMGARNLVETGLSYTSPDASYACGIDSLQSIPGLLKSLKIASLYSKSIPSL